ncbi:MAG TPA: CapA family protein, partial [Candidatus Limnocylindria bacterium]|nr:CapA family protein [Candidatus Limnocylindria bacterium]
DRPGIAPLELAILREDLARWRPEVEVLVVSVHWGSMYVDYPPPRVLELAETLAAGGVDLVLGHHPHVMQGYRRSGRTLALFSLGDACFNARAGDFEASAAAVSRRESGVFTALVAATPGLLFEALRLDDDGVPRGVAEAEAASFAARLARLSHGLAEGAEGFRRESAPQLLRYELESARQYVRQGRWDRLARLVVGLRPRHLPVLWQALRRLGRTPA